MEAVPEARRFAFLTDPAFTPPTQLSALQNATRARGVEVAIFKAGTPEQIAPILDEAKAWGATALNVFSAPLFSFNRRIVIEQAAALGLPAIYEWPEMAEEGGLIGYGARLPLVYRQLAGLLAKVLRGVKPYQPDQFRGDQAGSDEALRRRALHSIRSDPDRRDRLIQGKANRRAVNICADHAQSPFAGAAVCACCF